MEWTINWTVVASVIYDRRIRDLIDQSTNWWMNWPRMWQRSLQNGRIHEWVWEIVGKKNGSRIEETRDFWPQHGKPQNFQEHRDKTCRNHEP